MSKMKLLSTAVIGLLILNLGIVGFLFFSKPLRPHDRPIGRPPFERVKPQNEIIEDLHFDSDQIRQYEILIEEHQVSIRTLNDSIRNVKSMLYLMLNTENFSDKLIPSELLGENSEKSILIMLIR